jgi:Protein of unknown function (DUF3037)
MPDPEEPKLQYRILRYLPNLMRDEWVNIGVLIGDPDAARYSMRIIGATTPGATEFHFWNPTPESTQAYAPTQATDGEIVESNLQDKSEKNLGLPRTPSYPKGGVP